MNFRIGDRVRFTSDRPCAPKPESTGLSQQIILEQGKEGEVMGFVSGHPVVRTSLSTSAPQYHSPMLRRHLSQAGAVALSWSTVSSSAVSTYQRTWSMFSTTTCSRRSPFRSSGRRVLMHRSVEGAD